MTLCEALRKALYRVEVETLEDVFDRFSIRELALMFMNLSRIPKTGSSRHRQYLTTRRRLERYRAGLGLGPRGGRETRGLGDRLDDFLDSLRDRIQRRRPPRDRALDATIRGLVQVSKDRRHRRIGPLELDPDCIENILEALDADNCEGAEEAFAECFGAAAGMGATPYWHDVDELVMK